MAQVLIRVLWLLSLTTTRHADDDNLADLFPVKEVSNEFRNLDDDDDSAELVLHLRALDKLDESSSVDPSPHSQSYVSTRVLVGF